MEPIVTGVGTITVKRYEPFRFMPSHRHDFSKVSFMLSGGVKEHRGADETYAEAGWAVVKPAGVLHEDEVGPKGLCTLTLVADPKSEQVKLAWRGLVSEYRWIPIDRCVGRLIRLWLNRIEQAEPVIEEVVLSLASEVDRCRKISQCTPWFQKALGVLNESYATPPSLSVLADEVAVHPVTLSKQFRAHGTNKSEFVHRLRVQHAMTHLETENSLTWIAAENGYADSAHFTRSFRHWVGCTPSQFRKQFVRKD